MPDIKNPREGDLQTIIVSKEKAKTIDEAKKIAKDSGATHLEYDETDTSFRFRQRNPTDFVDGAYRSKALPNGATLVYGKLKDGIQASENTMPKMRSLRGVPVAIQLNEDKSLPEEIQVLRTGTFYDPRYKNFPITPEMLLSMKKNFDDKVRGIDLSLDYEHQTEGRSAGWFKELTLKDNNTQLWAKIEWTPTGQKSLSDKEFRYVSADFLNDYIDNETKKSHGPTLRGAALTNRPVIKGMEPVVQLTEVEIEVSNEDETQTQDTGGNTMDPKDQEIADLKKKCEELQAKIDGMGAGSQEMADMKKQLEEYKAKELADKEAKICSEKKDKFAKMLSEGKAVEAQREAFMAGDLGKFTELAQPVKLSEGGHSGDGSGNGGTGATEKTPEQEIIALAEEKMKANDKLTVGEATALVLSEKPELAKKYNERN